jgi:hypothetical protein
MKVVLVLVLLLAFAAIGTGCVINPDWGIRHFGAGLRGGDELRKDINRRSMSLVARFLLVLCFYVIYQILVVTARPTHGGHIGLPRKPKGKRCDRWERNSNAVPAKQALSTSNVFLAVSSRSTGASLRARSTLRRKWFSRERRMGSKSREMGAASPEWLPFSCQSDWFIQTVNGKNNSTFVRCQT